MAVHVAGEGEKLGKLMALSAKSMNVIFDIVVRELRIFRRELYRYVGQWRKTERQSPTDMQYVAYLVHEMLAPLINMGEYIKSQEYIQL